jgi:hypothetical protein
MHFRVTMLGFLWGLSGCGNAGSAFDGFYVGETVSSGSGAAAELNTGVTLQITSAESANGIVLVSNHFNQDVFATVAGANFTFPVQSSTSQISGSGQVLTSAVTGGSGSLLGAHLHFSVLMTSFLTVDGGAPSGAISSTLTFAGDRQ